LTAATPKHEGQRSEGPARRRRDRRRLEKTSVRRIYRRVDADGETVDYVAVFDVAGRQHKKIARTFTAAKRLKLHGGDNAPERAITFLKFLDEWVERYRGQGRRGFRDQTREEYRRLIRAYAHRYFSARLKLVDVSPYLLARFVDWLCDEETQGRRLSDKTIANIVIPLRTALKTAAREGLIQHNPSQDLALPHREENPDDEEDVRVFSREQLAAVLSAAPDEHRLLLELLAGCGLRISDVALQRRHFRLDDGPPAVRVRRAYVKGRIVPPKSKHGRRSILLPPPLAGKVRTRMDATPGEPTDLFFRSDSDGFLDADALRRRMLKPLVDEAGAGWAAFHAFRHTFASIHLSEGTHVVAVSRALGHHSAAFTLSRYAHLLPGELAPPLDLDAVLEKPDEARALHCPTGLGQVRSPEIRLKPGFT
jgi:integrase